MFSPSLKKHFDSRDHVLSPKLHKELRIMIHSQHHLPKVMPLIYNTTQQVEFFDLFFPLGKTYAI